MFFIKFNIKMKITMRYLCACAIALLFLFASPANSHAQAHFATPTYTPRFTPVFHSQNYSNYYGTVSMRHKFKIVFKDGTDTTVSTKIQADTPSYYLMLVNKSVGRDDSGRYRKIVPAETQYIVRLDGYNVDRDMDDNQTKGTPADSCWLFKAIDGKISAYSALAENVIDDPFLLYIQKDNGPLIRLTDENLEDMVSTNEKATRQAKKKDYTKAIRTYNKSTQ